MLMGYTLDVAACCWSAGGWEGERNLTWYEWKWDTTKQPLEPGLWIVLAPGIVGASLPRPTLGELATHIWQALQAFLQQGKKWGLRCENKIIFELYYSMTIYVQLEWNNQIKSSNPWKKGMLLFLHLLQQSLQLTFDKLSMCFCNKKTVGGSDVKTKIFLNYILWRQFTRKLKWNNQIKTRIDKKKNTIQWLLRRSLILVLLSPKHLKLWSSDGI
jgi:hypothetical protein